MTQTPEAEPTTWAQEFLLPQQMMDDPPMVEHTIGMHTEQARRAAAQAGYEFAGEPEITQEPAYWIAEMNDGRGGIVGEGFARSVGHTGGPTGQRFVCVWQIRKLATADAP